MCVGLFFLFQFLRFPFIFPDNFISLKSQDPNTTNIACISNPIWIRSTEQNYTYEYSNFVTIEEQIFRAVIKAEYPGPKLEWISSTAPSRHIRHCRRYLPQSSINLSVYGSLAWIWLMFEIKFHTTAHKCTVQTLCYRKRQSGSLPLRKGR